MSESPPPPAPATPKGKREAVITLLTTLQHASAAMRAVKTKIVTHNLSAEYEPYHCWEKVDDRGSRDSAVGRAARPMINVQDGEEENKRKVHTGFATTTRITKTTRADGTRATYTKYLGTHVMLYAAGRRVPTKGFHASHLCLNDRCIRATHVRVENEQLNQRRKGCSGLLVCSVCNNKWQLCTHDPMFPCLVVTEFVCCDPQHPSRVTSVESKPVVDEPAVQHM